MRLGEGVTSQVYRGAYNSGKSKDRVQAEAPDQQVRKADKIQVAIKVIQLNMIKEQNMQKFLN